MVPPTYRGGRTPKIGHQNTNLQGFVKKFSPKPRSNLWRRPPLPYPGSQAATTLLILTDNDIQTHCYYIVGNIYAMEFDLFKTCFPLYCMICWKKSNIIIIIFEGMGHH